MKRSKIFLALTASILGIAAFAASRAKWHQIQSFYSTLNAAGVRCTAFGLTPVVATTNTASEAPVLIPAGQPYAGNQLFATSTCEIPLYEGGQ